MPGSVMLTHVGFDISLLTHKVTSTCENIGGTEHCIFAMLCISGCSLSWKKGQQIFFIKLLP